MCGGTAGKTVPGETVTARRDCPFASNVPYAPRSKTSSTGGATNRAVTTSMSPDGL